jgi:hypothetical protein
MATSNTTMRPAAKMSAADAISLAAFVAILIEASILFFTRALVYAR